MSKNEIFDSYRFKVKTTATTTKVFTLNKN